MTEIVVLANGKFEQILKSTTHHFQDLRGKLNSKSLAHCVVCSLETKTRPFSHFNELWYCFICGCNEQMLCSYFVYHQMLWNDVCKELIYSAPIKIGWLNEGPASIKFILYFICLELLNAWSGEVKCDGGTNNQDSSYRICSDWRIGGPLLWRHHGTDQNVRTNIRTVDQTSEWTSERTSERTS